jgi:CTP:molybdopterin cytidylyltransferase MocA
MAKAVEVLILAAGLSTRLGQHKAMIDIKGNPLIHHIVNRLHRSGMASITVVTNSDLLANVMLASPSANVVLNPSPELGRTESIRCGLRSIIERLGSLPKRVLIVPIDRPGWDEEIIRSLVCLGKSTYPVASGKGGHPLYLEEEDIRSVYLSKGDVPLKDIVNCQAVEVDFDSLHLNIDTPEDLELLNDAATESWF